MSLFFFACVRSPEMVGNDFGLELPHLHAARVHALRMARRVMAAGSDGKGWRDWTVEISDGSGHRLSVIPFPGSAVQATGARRAADDADAARA